MNLLTKLLFPSNVRYNGKTSEELKKDVAKQKRSDLKSLRRFNRRLRLAISEDQIDFAINDIQKIIKEMR